MNSSAVNFFCLTILKKVVTSELIYPSSAVTGLGGKRVGEIGSIFSVAGTLTEVRLTGILSLISLIYLLENDPPRLVLRADPMLTSRGSSARDGLLDASKGSIFLGYYSLNDFFLVC